LKQRRRCLVPAVTWNRISAPHSRGESLAAAVGAGTLEFFMPTNDSQLVEDSAGDD
jgi:hypothetical protein